MTCSFAAVEPTSDSALPIRAKLSGGPNERDGTWPPLSPKIRDFRGPRYFALPIRAELDGAWGRETPYIIYKGGGKERKRDADSIRG